MNLDTIVKIAIAVTIAVSISVNIHFNSETNNTINQYIEKSEKQYNDTQIKLSKIDKIQSKILRQVD